MAMRPMEWPEASRFLLGGTRTAVVATVGQDGRPHAVPVWFTVDEGRIVFTTTSGSVKAKHLHRDPRVAICVDEATPPFAFVSLRGTAELTPRPDNFLAWTTRIARRYVGDERAEETGRAFTEVDDLLVRIAIESWVGHAEIVD
jgi:PPOX class probable F420-dependent enzyme